MDELLAKATDGIKEINKMIHELSEQPKEYLKEMSQSDDFDELYSKMLRLKDEIVKLEKNLQINK